MKKSFFAGLTLFEFFLWLGSVCSILFSYLFFSDPDPLVLLASLVGATALIYLAKGYPVGQMLTVVFSLLYGWISFRLCYYGEMITYLGMSAPAAVAATVSWLRHPYQKGKAEVRIRAIKTKDLLFVCALTVVVTALFGPILRLLETPNLFWSIFSVSTSFFASALTYLRSPYYALAYVGNDIVLIVLWSIAAWKDRSYVPMIVCFVVFLVNDTYGFFHWCQMRKRQSAPLKEI